MQQKSMQKIASVTNLMLDENDVEAPVVHRFCEIEEAHAECKIYWGATE